MMRALPGLETNLACKQRHEGGAAGYLCLSQSQLAGPVVNNYHLHLFVMFRLFFTPPSSDTPRSPAMTRLVRANMSTLKKTASYYLVHITVAAAVAYAVTGDFLLALTLSLLEPTVQAFAFFFHEKAWQRWGGQRQARPAQATQPAAVPA
jgi:uncharacterized membrane protein